MSSGMLTLRFDSYSYYDVIGDAMTQKVLAITNRGTWWTEYPVARSSAMRAKRKAFEERVLELIEQNEWPAFVPVEDEALV